MSLKTRIEKEANYRSVWCNGKTLRFAINPKKPITELKYPEFYDVKVTGNCDGACPWCYMDSKSEKHYENIIDKFRLFFGNIDKDKLPFQIAFGGGEPTSHPDFIELMKVCKEEFDICPNYTTNGMWWTKDNFQEQANLLNATKQYCGGVAISCHPHLKQYWLQASEMYIMNNIKLNFHIIISDKESIDDFIEIYNEWKDKVDYFVLLPYGNVGRAPKKEIDWEYLVSKLPEDQHQIAFGANFYPYLLKGEHNIKISLYEPEIMSKYMDLKDMNIYPSSFNLNKIN
jgi:organic radical activating enzyme